MYCNKCGKDNSDDAVYCQKCGAVLQAEEETRVAGRYYLPIRPRSADTPPIQGGEQITKIFSITPTLMFVKLAYLLAILGAFLLVALFSTLLSPFVGIWP